MALEGMVLSWIRYIFFILTFLFTGAVCLNAAESVAPNPWLLNLSLRKAGFVQREGKLLAGWKDLRRAILWDVGLPSSITEVVKTPDVLAPIAKADVSPLQAEPLAIPILETDLSPRPEDLPKAPETPKVEVAVTLPPEVAVAKEEIIDTAVVIPTPVPPAPPFVGGGGKFRADLKTQPWPAFSPDWLVRLALVAVPYPITGTGDSIGGASDTVFWQPKKSVDPIPQKLVDRLLAVDGFVDENFGIYFGWNTHLAFYYSPSEEVEAPVRGLASVEDSPARTDVVSMLRRLCESRDYAECATLARFELAAGNKMQALALAGLACEEGVIAGCEVRGLVLARLGRIDEAKEILKPLCQGITPCRSLASIEAPVVLPSQFKK